MSLKSYSPKTRMFSNDSSKESDFSSISTILCMNLNQIIQTPVEFKDFVHRIHFSIYLICVTCGTVLIGIYITGSHIQT